MQTMWAGRFEKNLDAKVNDFNSSISFDARMFSQDIKGSLAHAAMLCAQHILTQEEYTAITDGLCAVLEDLQSGKLAFDPVAEDIHMFVEAELTKRIGAPGKKLHTARSRNDQVALDLRMYLMDEAAAVSDMLLSLEEVLLKKADAYAETILPGYTHLQRAQPVTFGHHLMAYANMFARDLDRLADCKERMAVSPLGACALAGTTYDTDRQMTAETLGFDEPCPNSLDGVSDRDFVIEMICALAMVMMHLSRFSEEIILWCSWEFKFIELDDAYATGSSIMPQKKNPDVAELIRGKTGRVYGDLMAILTVMKGLPLAYNKDMQEDKEAVFDALDTVKLCLPVFTKMIDTMTVLSDNMRAAAAKGFINATDCADYLTKKGVPFRDAYKITGKLVGYGVKNGKTLEDMTMEEYKAASDVFDTDVYDAIDLMACVNKRTSFGGTAPDSVYDQIADMKTRLNL
ncbi:MAG: argininosuccinate lyase [Clostridia bacterium]|nr:argininosuccinate lyase [Clostridia bacterium]